MSEKLNLNGKWHLKQLNGNVECEATVPGCNFTALLDNKLIKDPFDSTNEKDMTWVSDSAWEYSREFEVSKEVLDAKFVSLEAKMLDTIATVYINEELVAKTENCHIEYSFDVKKYLKEGLNTIRVSFASPVEWVKAKQAIEKVPANNNGQNGIPHIRKPQCHYGWDWGPVLVPTGIPKDIYISYANVSDIDLVDITQEHNDGNVKVAVKANAKDNQKYNWKVTILDPNDKELFTKAEETDKVDLDYVVEDPKLWWTYELNRVEKQPLYTIEVDILDGEKVARKVVKKIGLRTIKLNTSKDKYGSNFCFEVNGVPIFAKGANWIPADSFIDRVDKRVYDFYFDAARFSNFNMIRIWGGGFYGDDYMYEKADEMGILLWQDFMFACMPYPFFDDVLLNNVLDEITFNVHRLKHHASLALWCGNNEIEVMSIQWLNRKKYLDWTEKFFYHILPEHLSKLDTDTPFIPGSPYGIGYNKGFGNDNVGDTHLWAVWHGLQPLDYYRKRMTRFCSEFGFESLPDMKTIAKYATEKDYSLSSEVFNAHQKCASGNNKMKYYIASRFSLPKNFTDYVYLSQICQVECVRDATEHWRRNKGRCNGSMYWQFNDCWPVCSWASLDYYGNYKALQYCARHFNNDIFVSLLKNKENVEAYINNDTLKDVEAKLNISLISFMGEKKLEKDVDVKLESNKVAVVEALKMADYNDINLKDYVLAVKVIVDNKVVSERTLLFDIEKKLALPKAKINMKVEKKDNKAIITLSSDVYAHYVSVFSKTNVKHFSDNYFDLLPGEEKVIEQGLFDVNADITNDYEITSLCDIEAAGSKAHDNWERFKVFMEPINFFSYLYNCIIPKDVKVEK